MGVAGPTEDRDNAFDAGLVGSFGTSKTVSNANPPALEEQTDIHQVKWKFDYEGWIRRYV